MTAKRVLIADDDTDLSRLLSMRCNRMGLEVFRSPDAVHALLGVHRAKPDLVLLDVNMPSGNGLGVCEMLAGDRNLSSIPVIIMTGAVDDETRRRCQNMGARLVKKGPQLWEELEPMIGQALNGEISLPSVPTEPETPARETPHASSRPKVLLVDDEADITNALKIRLDSLGVDVVCAYSGMQGYWSCLDHKPDVVVTDLNMPDGEGNYLFYRLKEHPLTANIPVIVLTGQCNPALKRHLLSIGIDAYLTKPVVLDELLARLRCHITFEPRHHPETV